MTYILHPLLGMSLAWLICKKPAVEQLQCVNKVQMYVFHQCLLCLEGVNDLSRLWSGQVSISDASYRQGSAKDQHVAEDKSMRYVSGDAADKRQKFPWQQHLHTWANCCLLAGATYCIQ